LRIGKRNKRIVKSGANERFALWNKFLFTPARSLPWHISFFLFI